MTPQTPLSLRHADQRGTPACPSIIHPDSQNKTGISHSKTNCGNLAAERKGLQKVMETEKILILSTLRAQQVSPLQTKSQKNPVASQDCPSTQQAQG